MTTREVREAGNAAQRAAGAERARERLAAYDRGLRGDDLAAALGVAPGSVRQVLTRARRRLGLPDPRKAVMHLVQFSTGAGSAEVAWRVVEKYGHENVVLLAADTLVEDEDNWRFGNEVAVALGLTITRLADGRTPMEVGRDVKVVPSNRFAVCSRILKRDLLRAYMEEHYDPATSVVYLGFDWTEAHRYDAALPHWSPWRIECPLMDRPYLEKTELLDLWRSRGIEPPRLYAQGFRHANCGGACVRGGQAQWGLLLQVNPTRYREWENEEQKTREHLAREGEDERDVSILKRVRAGVAGPLTLRQLRLELEPNPEAYDHDDHGPCGCTEELFGV